MPKRTAYDDARLVAARVQAQHQGGPRACLDGASTLVAGGLEHYTVERHRVSVPRGARVRRTKLYDIRQTRRWSADDLAASGIRRTRPDVAGVRAALWATSDKQAVYVLTLVVQQGLTTAEPLGTQALAPHQTGPTPPTRPRDHPRPAGRRALAR